MNREKLRLTGIALVAIILLIVFAQNLGETEVRILFLDITMPLAVLLVGIALLGYVSGLFSAGVLIGKKKKAASKDDAASKKAE